MVLMTVEIAEDRQVTYARQTIRRILKETNYAVARRWQTKYLKLHFRRGNQKRYKYRRRTWKYLRRKRKQAEAPRPGQQRVLKGGRVALVFSGFAEQLFARRHAIRATSTRAKITMHGPRYVTMKPFKSQRHALGADIVKVIPQETRDLEEFAQDTMERLFRNAPTRRRRRKIR